MNIFDDLSEEAIYIYEQISLGNETTSTLIRLNAIEELKKKDLIISVRPWLRNLSGKKYCSTFMANAEWCKWKASRKSNEKLPREHKKESVEK